MNLDDVQNLSQTLGEIPDDRPDWLKATCLAPDWKYYRLLHEVAKRMTPLRAIEIGTDRAGGAAHLAYANAKGNVITIDIDPEATARAMGLPVSNVLAILGGSMQVADRVAAFGPFDICFIDANHELQSAYPEYARYRQMVKQDGLIFFDDVDDRGLFPTMIDFWDMIADPKTLLPGMHYSGFGVCQVKHEIVPPPL